MDDSCCVLAGSAWHSLECCAPGCSPLGTCPTRHAPPARVHSTLRRRQERPDANCTQPRPLAYGVRRTPKRRDSGRLSHLHWTLAVQRSLSLSFLCVCCRQDTPEWVLRGTSPAAANAIADCSQRRFMALENTKKRGTMCGALSCALLFCKPIQEHTRSRLQRTTWSSANASIPLPFLSSFTLLRAKSGATPHASKHTPALAR